MQQIAGETSILILRDLFSGPALDAMEWEPFRQGIEIRWIYVIPGGPRAALLRYAPGACLQRHAHVAFEHILVLRGAQIDDNGEHPAGTLIVHSAGTSHAVSSPLGCVVLAIWEKPVHVGQK